MVNGHPERLWRGVTGAKAPSVRMWLLRGNDKRKNLPTCNEISVVFRSFDGKYNGLNWIMTVRASTGGEGLLIHSQTSMRLLAGLSFVVP